MDAILSNNPLSSGYRAKLMKVLGGQPDTINFVELRQLPLPKLARKLRTLRYDRIVVPTEDPQGEALNAILYMLAHLTSAKSVVACNPRLEIRTVSRAETLGLMAQTAIASARGRLALVRARREVSSLGKQTRKDPVAARGRRGLFLNANLWFGIKAGGSVGHISGVVNAFEDLGYPMTFASAGGRMQVRDAVPLEDLKPPRFFGVPWEMNYYRFNYCVVDQISELARRRPFDFIYQRLSLANFSGVTLSRELGVPLILEYNGSEAWVARNWGRPLRYDKLAEDAELAAIRHAHLVVAISDVLRDELVERGVPPERVVSYPNCIDEELIDPGRFSDAELVAARAAYGIDKDAVVVTFLGTFGRWHGTEYLAAAVAKLADEHGAWCNDRRVHFLFIGDGLRMPEVRAALGRHVDHPMITFAGLIPQEDAPICLAMSDILMSPHAANADGSRFFGSPTKLFEYMAMGKAILASDLDQIGEILAGSDHIARLGPDAAEPAGTAVALMATPGNIDELADGIRFLVDRPAWRATIGRRARELALSRYTWRHHVGAIVDQASALGLLSEPRRDQIERVDHAASAAQSA